MIVAYFYDTRMVLDKSRLVYYSNGFSYNVWERYLNVFNKVIVAKRCKTQEDNKNILNNFGVANGIGVAFSPITKYESFKDIFLNYRTIRNQIRYVISECDCLIIRLPSIIGILACYEAKKLDKVYAVEIVGNAYDTLAFHGSINGKYCAPIYEQLIRRAIKNAPVAAYITKEYLQNIYKCNGEIFSEIANVSLSPVPSIILEYRIKKIKEINNKLRIGLIGSLDVNYKGQSTAMHAIKLLIDKGIECHLDLVGGGNKLRWIKLAEDLGISDRISLYGHLKAGKNVYEWIDTLDIYIQPSMTEAHGRSVIEAMSRGCPVLSSDVGGLRESVQEKYRFKADDYIILAEKIYNLIRFPNEMEDMAKFNYKYAQNFYNEIIEYRRKQFLQCLHKKTINSIGR
jgi:glycosyltransferase involved in cell wall biosynthesis